MASTSNKTRHVKNTNQKTSSLAESRRRHQSQRSDFRRFVRSAADSKPSEVRPNFGFVSEAGQFCKRRAAKAGRAHGYYRCLGRGEASRPIATLWAICGASRPSQPVSAGFRLRNGTKRRANRRAQVVCSRGEKWSAAVGTGRSQGCLRTATRTSTTAVGGFDVQAQPACARCRNVKAAVCRRGRYHDRNLCTCARFAERGFFRAT